MHEYPLTQTIIETAQRYATSHGAKKVTAIDLVVGEASGCVAESIEMYFDLIAVGGVCAEAKLRFERVKPMLKCDACGKLFLRKPFSFACTREGCNGEGVPTEIGREFYIKSIHVE